MPRISSLNKNALHCRHKTADTRATRRGDTQGSLGVAARIPAQGILTDSNEDIHKAGTLKRCPLYFFTTRGI